MVIPAGKLEEQLLFDDLHYSTLPPCFRSLMTTAAISPQQSQPALDSDEVMKTIPTWLQCRCRLLDLLDGVLLLLFWAERRSLTEIK